MNLAAISAAIRPRTSAEAMDLGVALARAFFGAVFWPTAVLVAAVASVALLCFEPAVAILVVWWLKPLYDRVALFVLSRALFGATPGFWKTLGQMPRVIAGGALYALTLARFSPFRSFVLPVVALEGARGDDAAQRKRVLLDGTGGAAFAATSLCQILEQCLALGATLLVFWCTPGRSFEDLAALFDPERTGGEPESHPLLLAGWLFALTFVEVIYVAAGFALYLNRRTWLEGWDVEIAFRRLAARAADRGRPARRPASVGVLLLFLVLGISAPVSGQESRARSPEEAIRKVLAEPEFSTKRLTRQRVEGERGPTLSGRSDSFTSGVGGVLEVVLWSALVVAAVGLGAALLKRRGTPGPKPRPAAPAPPRELFGLDLRTESLPDDPARVALATFDAGDQRGAVALLYRAALSHLTNARDVAIAGSDTEGDCVARVRGLGMPELEAAFAELTLAWQSTAYAHAGRSRGELAKLCAAHTRHFTVLP